MNPISSVRILLVFAGKQLTLGTLAPTAREPERARRKDPRRIFDLEGGGDETPPRPRGVATRSIRESQRPRDRRPVVIGHAIFPRRTRSLARKFLRESEARILPLPPPALPLAGMFSGAVFGERKFVKVTPRRREHYLRSREARGSADREKAERKVSWGGERGLWTTPVLLQKGCRSIGRESIHIFVPLRGNIPTIWSCYSPR